MSQEYHPPSVFLMLWSRGKDEDHTLPALRVCGGEHGGPCGSVHPALEERTALLMVPISPQGMSMVVTVHSHLMV